MRFSLKTGREIATVALASLLLAPVAHAGALDAFRENTTTAATGAGLDTSKNDTAGLIGGIIGSFLGLLGLVAVVLMVYAGFIWMTAQGSEEKVKQAKGIIRTASIGLVIVFASYAITNAVLTYVGEGLSEANQGSTDPNANP